MIGKRELALFRHNGRETLHSAYMTFKKQKAQFENWAKCLIFLGWLMGLEPTTTGITILDSTN